GRTYLARSKEDYNLLWYVAPDSYAATNAASSGAFVLSESYLYTKEAIVESLKHLSDDGIMVMQFGELDFEHRPSRTSRYVITARAAFSQLGIKDAPQHMLVSAFITHRSGDLSTIILKRSPFTAAEVARFRAAVPKLPDMHTVWAPGIRPNAGIVSQLAGASTDASARKIAATYPLDVGAVTDNRPFFWHFAPYNDVIRDIVHPLRPGSPTDDVGERVLLLLLAIAVLYAFIFLL